MVTKRKNRIVFRSMEEFRSRYFPNERKQRIIETPEEARTMGVNMARTSVEKVKLKL